MVPIVPPCPSPLTAGLPTEHRGPPPPPSFLTLGRLIFPVMVPSAVSLSACFWLLTLRKQAMVSSAGQRAILPCASTRRWDRSVDAVAPWRQRSAQTTTGASLPLLRLLMSPPPPPPPLMLLLLSNMSLLFRAFPAESGNLQNTEGGASDPWEDCGCALRVRTGVCC